MASPDLVQFENDRTLAVKVAALWAEDFPTTLRGRPHYVALSGGRIARHFFSASVDQFRQNTNVLDAVEFFWADERCVPPTDPESNFALAQETLFAPLSISPTRIHRIRGELDPGVAAGQAEADICQVVPLDQAGQPVLDLVFLGMGEDGHIASLFPDAQEDQARSQRVYQAVFGPKPPPRRITLTYPALAAARQVWVLASGAGKEDALRRSLTSSADTPLGRLLKRRQTTRIFTDIRLAAT